MDYTFLAPARIRFGWGCRVEVGGFAREICGREGGRVFLVVGSRTLTRNGALAEIEASLAAAGVEPVRLAEISQEPEVDDVDRAVRALIEAGAAEGDMLLAVGGGSAIDLAKAAAALATNREGKSVKDYLEGVGRSLSIGRPPLPLLAMPTTSGTGSEATKNAVISSYDPPFKKSLRSDLMMPKAVLVDPQLSISVPPEITAWTGMDAITQLIESYVSKKARPIPQALALAGLPPAVTALVEAVRDGGNRQAREAMAHAALLSGMALANSGLGLAHGVAAALGSVGRVPHGLACAVMLPVAIHFNRPACEEQFARLGEAMAGRSFGTPSAAADAAEESVHRLCEAVGVPRRLSAIGIRAEQIPALVAGSHGNSRDGNPRDISDEELAQLLSDML